MKKYTFLTVLFLSISQSQQSCNSFITKSKELAAFQFLRSGTRVLDKRTGLVWSRCLEGQIFNDNKTPTVFLDDTCNNDAHLFSRQEALLYVQKRKNYRLPNIKELASIVELQCTNPAINLTAFPNQPNYWVWSATYVNLEYSQNSALSISFQSGLVGFSNSKKNAIRLIRYNNLKTS